MPSDHLIRVLLVDDDLADRELTRYALRGTSLATYETTVATSLTEAEPHLQAGEFDVLLLDLGLPESSGKQTLVKVREINRHIPIVVLSDLNDDAVVLECLEQGAQDYIFKSQLETDSISRSMRYAIQRQQQQQAIWKANQLLEIRNAELARLCDTAERFVDNVSHEFRTPLTVITEYVALLLDGVVGSVELDAEQKRFLSILADRANDLNTMVDDMLDVSKLESGLLSTWRKDCQLADIIHHLKPALQSKATLKEVELEFDFQEDLPVIFCDDEKLGRVLINLVVNAIKFCGVPGKVRVWAESRPEDRELAIFVSDNGPGITAENQAMIFGRFQQLDTGIQSAQKGFGLGLSIAKELVDLNLGHMSLSSQLNHGSTFSFTVPFADPIEVADRYIGQLQKKRSGNDLALFEIRADAYENESTLDDVDAFLNYVTRPEDLLFRYGPSRWVCVVPCSENETQPVLPARIHQMREENNRNRPGFPLPVLEAQCVGQWAADDGNLLIKAMHQLNRQTGEVHA